MNTDTTNISLTTPDANAVASSGVIVSGASSGLGRATALLCAQAGRPVAVWGRDTQRSEQVAAACRASGVDALALAFDIGDRQAVSRAVEQSQEALGRIGGLALCHGICPLGSVGALDFKTLDDCLLTNLTSLAYTIEAALPVLRTVGRGAAIVAALSTSSLRSAPISAEYTVSKHGALGLIRAAARSLGAEGIRVNAVCPGAMDTPMMDKAMEQAGEAREQVKAAMMANIPLGYIADPVEVAQVMLFMISPESSYVNGADIPVDGGMIV